MTNIPKRRFLITTLVIVVATMGVAAVAAPTAAAGDAGIGNDDGMDDGSWWSQSDNATFDSASAEVTEESDGEVSEVTFTYDAPRGKLVRLQAGHQSELRWATGEERDIGVDLRRWFFPAPEEYPVEVSAEILGGEECTATIEEDAGVVTLCEDEPAETETGTLEGVLSEDETYDRIEGTVIVKGEDLQVETDENGAYAVDLEPGEYTITATADGYMDEYRNVTIEAGETTSATFALSQTGEEPAEPEQGMLEGTVTDNETGEPIAGATVSNGEAEFSTDENGTFSVSAEVGDYTVTANASGYESASQNVTLTANETTTADFALDPIDEEPEDGTLEGTVTDNATGEPIANATVSNGEAEFTTDENGTFSASAAAGEYTVTASADGYESASQNVTLTAGKTTMVDFALVPTDDEPAEPEEGTLEGTVTDNATGEPIAGATVSNGEAEFTTDENGTFSATADVGDYTVTASADGYESASQNVTLSANETTTADFALESTDEEPVEPEEGTLEGAVTDTETDEPIEGATISNGEAEFTTDANGNFSATVSPGEYTVTASADGYESASQNVTVTANETTSAFFTLTPEGPGEGTLEGTVTDNETGEPIEGATVSNGDAEFTTDANGSFSATVSPGEYTVTANASGYQSASQDVTLTDGETTTADFALTPEADDEGPREFSGYIRGDEAYFHTGTDQQQDPITFTQCRDGQPTDQALSESPDYLPDPECTTIEGTYFPSNNSWTGNIDFPPVVQERTSDALGDIYVRANIQAGEASGMLNRETGELTVDTTVEIPLVIANVDSHGNVTYEEALAQDRNPVSDDGCRIPNVDLSLSTENSFDSSSSFTDNGTVEGQPLGDDNVALAVDNQYSVDGATECGEILGTVQINNRVNGQLGLPAESGNNEIAMDAELNFEE